MSLIDHIALAEAMLPAVLEAARVQMRYFIEGVDVERKADRSPVTIADREAEAILIEGLARAAPGVPVVAEESTAVDGAPAKGRLYLAVDPLDGTREFIQGRPEFTINIGLVADGVPVFGLVYAPVFEMLYVTLGPLRAVGTRVARAGPEPALGTLALVPLRVREAVDGHLVALESRSHADPQADAWLDSHGVVERRKVGSSLKFCLIARGEADVYVRCVPTCVWDTVAGHAVLTAAGGSVVTLDGAPFDYRGAGHRNPGFVAWGRRAG